MMLARITTALLVLILTIPVFWVLITIVNRLVEKYTDWWD